MNFTKRKALIAVLFIGFFISSSFKTSELKEDFGFYLNNGQDKIAKLDCYSFDDLMIKFPVLPEMHGYDIVQIVICKNGGDSRCVDQCGVTYDGNVFRAKYKDVSSGELTIFRKGEQQTGLESSGTFNRYSLKHTVSKKSVADASLHFFIRGYMITGYSEEIVGNKIVKKPIYSSPTAIFISEKIALENREKIGVLKGVYGEQVVDLSIPCN